MLENILKDSGIFLEFSIGDVLYNSNEAKIAYRRSYQVLRSSREVQIA